MNHTPHTIHTLDALLSLDIFRSCDVADVTPLLPAADVLTLRANEVIDRAGTSARQFVGIVDGYVRGVDVDGETFLLGPGDQIGAGELFDHDLHRATYTTTATSTLVAVFGPAFSARARSVPHVVERARAPRRRPLPSRQPSLAR